MNIRKRTYISTSNNIHGMKQPSLLLCPEDPTWIPPDNKRLTDFLQSIQLIGTASDHPITYLVGEKFLDMIAFMGCSPDIKLEPDGDDQSYCYIQIKHAPAIEFRHGEHSHAPRCPTCRQPVEDWQSRVQLWLEAETKDPWKCSACQQLAAPWEYNWRKSAGFGRSFIEIRNIFPKEALPQSLLLDTLQSHYGIKWQYFYQY